MPFSFDCFVGGISREEATRQHQWTAFSWVLPKQETKPIDSNETIQNDWEGANANARNRKANRSFFTATTPSGGTGARPVSVFKFDISLPFFRPGLPVFCSTYDAANVLLPRSRNVNLQRLKLGFALEKTARLALDNFFTISGFNGSMGCLRG